MVFVIGTYRSCSSYTKPESDQNQRQHGFLRAGEGFHTALVTLLIAID